MEVTGCCLEVTVAFQDEMQTLQTFVGFCLAVPTIFCNGPLCTEPPLWGANGIDRVKQSHS